LRLIVLILLILLVSFIIYAEYVETGIASWYGPDFHGKKTANGEIFNTNDFTAAHKTLPFGTIVKITSLENNKTTIVRINDRGPFVTNRIIDLSNAAATQLDMTKKGIMNVKIEVLEKGKNEYHKFNKSKYMIQVASFSEEDKAKNFINKFNNNILNMKISEVKLQKKYYRIIIDNLNYYQLQEMRVILHNNGITNYLIKRKAI
jgi:rare lipoprotein A